MKTSLVLALLFLFALPSLQAADVTWAGNFENPKFLNGQAVFHLKIVQQGNQMSVDFDAAYSDGHGCALEASGSAKVVDKNTLKFTFTDSFDNSGTGTIKRIAGGVIISVKPTQVADSRCVVFYGDNIRLKLAK